MKQTHRELRDAFGCYATGVAVVTCAPKGAPAVGMTINSFTSVSLEPPLILWCLDKSAFRFPTFSEADNYAVNVLSADQRAVSQAFASTKARIADHETLLWETGAPILKDCLASFDCRVFDRRSAGDHLVMIGEVVRFEAAKTGQPLVYFRSGYGVDGNSS